MSRNIKIVLLSIIIIGLCSCNQSTSIKNIEDNTLIATDLTIYMQEFFDDSLAKYESERESFCEIIKRDYGINLVINGIGDERLPPDYLEENDLVLTSSFNIDFLVNTINKETNKSLISPIDEYLTTNSFWQNLPDYYKNLVSYEGKVYGIPLTYSTFPYFDVRFVRDDWLSNLGLEVPISVEDYYQTMTSFTYNDPDLNKLDDTTGFISNGLDGLYDIFNSFDCNIKSYPLGAPTYNSDKGIYEDVITKDTMKDCLSYLSACYDNKLLSFAINRDDLYAKYETKRFGSVLKSVYALHRLSDLASTDYHLIAGLEGINKHHLIEAEIYFSKAYFLPESVTNKEEVINTFVNIFLADEKGYFMGRYGIPGEAKGENDFYIDGDNVYITSSKKGNSVNTGKGPNIINFVPGYEHYNIINYFEDTKLNELYERGNVGVEASINFFHENINQFNINPLKSFSAEWEMSNEAIGELSQMAQEILLTAIRGEVSIDDAISTYTEKANEMGLYNALENVNRKLIVDN